MIDDVERIPVTDRETWLALRKRDLTASDVAAIFGRSPHKTALQVYAEKAGLVEPDAEENEFMRRGRFLEPAILAALSEHEQFVGRTITPAREYLRSPSLRLGATPDAYVYGAGIVGAEPLDAKSVASFVHDQQWSEGVPLHIQIQVLVQAMLLNAARGWVGEGVLSADFPVYPYEIPRHAEAEAKIKEAVALFWAAVDAGEPPPPCAGDHNTLAALFPHAKRPDPLDWSEDEEVLALLNERATLAEEIKPKEGRKKEIDALIKARMGVFGLALAPGWKVTWTERKGYTAEVPASRVLRVTALNLEQEEAA